MSERYKTYEGGIFFVTLTTVGWIDVFSRAEYCDLIERNLNYCIEKKGLKVYSYCIMTNHLHLVGGSDDFKLTDILRDFKSYTAKVIIKAIADNPQESRKEWLAYMFQFFAKRESNNGENHFWQYGNHPIDLNTNELLEQKVEYIHQNPVKARMVNEAQNYIYSSANPLCGVKIEKL